MTESKQKLLHLFQYIKNNTVKFHTDFLGSRNTPMISKDFRLPFLGMDVSLGKAYKVNDIFITGFNITKFNNKYTLICYELNDLVNFQITETGEIIVETVDQTEFKKQSNEEMLMKAKMVFNGEKNVDEVIFDAVVNKEKHYYNLVYDIIATIDYLNHSEYVVTKHTTTNTKEGIKKLPSGKIETRVKIRHTKNINYTGQKHEGSKHRYKYRVRGHFRNYDGGEQIWIADHVRGGDGSIFIPKEYEF